MIVIAQVTNTSAVALFVAGFVPALVIMVCLMAVVYVRARMYDWPIDAKTKPEAPGPSLLARGRTHGRTLRDPWRVHFWYHNSH
jgi:C4-dicarboxylate transporter DctM subunit